jgi:3-oxoadipate enol-lactonase
LIESIKQQTGYIEVNRTRFYYEMAGTGTPLVLIHAGITDRRMWDKQFQLFAQHYQVIRPDTRGYGNTAMGIGDYSRSEDLHGLLTTLNLKPVILLGCSQGGTAVLDFTLEHPEMIRGLILVSAVPSGYNFEGEPPQKVLEFASAYQQQKLPEAAELATQIWFDGPQRQPGQVNSGIRGWVHDMIKDVVATGAIDVTGEKFSGRPAMDRLGNIQIPTLIITGDKDDPSVIEAGEYLAANISGAEKAVIHNAAHLPNIERPEEFNRIVLNFLQRQ